MGEKKVKTVEGIEYDESSSKTGKIVLKAKDYDAALKASKPTELLLDPMTYDPLVSKFVDRNGKYRDGIALMSLEHGHVYARDGSLLGASKAAQAAYMASGLLSNDMEMECTPEAIEELGEKIKEQLISYRMVELSSDDYGDQDVAAQIEQINQRLSEEGSALSRVIRKMIWRTQANHYEMKNMLRGYISDGVQTLTGIKVQKITLPNFSFPKKASKKQKTKSQDPKKTSVFEPASQHSQPAEYKPTWGSK
ncbi:MAG: hypothetical protein EOP06_01925 [Proteobacteria bacterium]|nr:MAG: hypothetical protein EOP06_01925 [Pseudomonadota bacterium]